VLIGLAAAAFLVVPAGAGVAAWWWLLGPSKVALAITQARAIR
jgi:hypothetical protein